MQLALLSDVHANYPALEAVFADLDTESVDSIVCAGDIVGYGPHPAKCVDAIRNQADVVVTGNHDRVVETPAKYRHHSTAYPGLKHARAELTAAQLAWLRNLPRTACALDGQVTVVHSHPDPGRQGEYVRPSSFATLASEVDDYDCLVLGHTHVQYAEKSCGTLVVNPGSVGQPRDGNPDAAYAVFDAAEHTVDLRRVEYDINATQDAIRAVGLPDESGTRLQDGR